MRAIFAAAALALAAGCSKNPAPAPASTPVAQTVVAAATAVAPEEGQHGEGRARGSRFRDSVVYVDGKPMGVLRYSELPPSLVPVAEPEIDDLDIARYYKLADYLAAIGVDLAAVRTLHVYGSHERVAIVSGDELRKLRDRLVFDFTQQTRGKPRARWAQMHALPHRPMVDVISGISVYVSKPAPTFDRDGDFVVDGKPITDGSLPYVGDDVPKGTRVYVDGKLAGFVRRKQLPDKLLAPGSDRAHARFSLDAFLASIGVDTRAAKAIDLYAGDDLAARLDARQWALSKSEYVFELPKRSHGKVKELLPGNQSARVSCVKLYVHASPPARVVEPEVFEPQEGGSDDSQPDDGSGRGGRSPIEGNAGNPGAPWAAQGVNQEWPEDE